MRNKPWLLRLACLAGFALLAAGAWRVISTENGAGLTALIIIGAILVLTPTLVPRLTGITVGTDGLSLSMAQELAEHGAVTSARLLDHTELGKLAEAYGVVHQELEGRHMPARIYLQDLLVSRAAAFAKQHRFDPAEIAGVFDTAAPVTRVLLIGLMKGDPRLLDAANLAAAIAQPASGNEQYHALALAKQHWNRFGARERSQLLAAADEAPIDIQAVDSRILAEELAALSPA